MAADQEPEPQSASAKWIVAVALLGLGLVPVLVGRWDRGTEPGDAAFRNERNRVCTDSARAELKHLVARLEHPHRAVVEVFVTPAWTSTPPDTRETLAEFVSTCEGEVRSRVSIRDAATRRELAIYRGDDDREYVSRE